MSFRLILKRGKLCAAELYGSLDSLPTGPVNNLLSPRKKQSREIYATRCYGTSKGAVFLLDHRFQGNKVIT